MKVYRNKTKEFINVEVYHIYPSKNSYVIHSNISFQENEILTIDSKIYRIVYQR